MNLFSIVLFSIMSLGIGLLIKTRFRKWVLLIGSVLVIYYLQPPLAIRNLDFWLPTLTLAVTVGIYMLTRPAENSFGRENAITSLVMIATVAALGVSRYVDGLCCITPTRPPQIEYLLIGLSLAALFIWLISKSVFKRKAGLHLFTGLVVSVFILLKNEALATLVSAWLRGLTGQSVDIASATDIAWLGYSYVAFRLIHTIRDRVSGRLPDLALSEYVTYVIFFPAFTSGPIDRVQRFVTDLRQKFILDSNHILQAGQRIILGMFKKFVIADSFALIALSQNNFAQSDSSYWTWIILFAYSIRLYYDFSGYTDIAIGLGNLLGFNLPENFNRPYLQPNITAFWNSWHITLAQWFRAYFFNPLTRALRSSKWKIPMPIVILSGQLSTMVLIGLWHGITWNFAIWGAWHGLGLFVHNRWSETIKNRFSLDQQTWFLQKAVAGVGVMATFIFVSVSWVWFVLPEPSQAWQVIQILFRMG